MRSALAKIAYSPSVHSPIATNSVPRIRDCSAAEPDFSSMNWGRNERKNRATFGLNVLTMMPWVKLFPRDNEDVCASIAWGFLINVRRPMNTR